MIQQIEFDTVRQAAHDIRSPLTALQMIVGSLAGVPEEKRDVLMSAMRQLDAIAADLLGKATSRPASPDAPCSEIQATLAELIAEKRAEFAARPEIEIRLQSERGPLFADFDARTLKRAISNLVNNAADAMEGRGVVTIAVRASAREVSITVVDQGRGVPAAILPLLGRRGFSHGKARGHGLGLSHARAAIESFGGRLAIFSREGVGTHVQATLPLKTALP